MSGKAYTLKEMKAIVDYIAEQKAFGEVKGRKMWVDFANSKLTVRTWQSLKETFLKRILPDIHNPYYKLTMDQVRSFKEGQDVAVREKNKLEIVNLDDDSNSNSNAEIQADNAQPSTSHANNGDEIPGEDVTCSKVKNHDRDSVDTVIIPTCYETAEDVQRALESPKSNVVNNNTTQSNDNRPPTKLRDLITYSEPLTPMLQEVLHDFATDEDSDSGEMRMQIVEDTIPDSEPQPLSNNSPIVVADSEPPVVSEQPPIEIFDSEDVVNSPNVAEEEEIPEESDDFPQPKVLSLKLKKRKGGYKIDKKKSEKTLKQKSEDKKTTEADESARPKESTNDDITETHNTSENIVHENQTTQSVAIPEKSVSHLSNSTDTILPNNQEALENSGKNTKSGVQIESEMEKSKLTKDTNEDKGKSKPRKRAISQDVTSTSLVKKKNILDIKSKSKDKAVSDTDTIKKKMKMPKDMNSQAGFAKIANEVNVQNSTKNKKIAIEPNVDTAKEPSAVDVENSNSSDLSQLNPCLKSVSLFAEQFNKVSYIESESDHNVKDDTKKFVETKKKKGGGNKIVENKTADGNQKKTVEKVNEVVILKSHSESGSESNEFSPKKSSAPKSRVPKSQREKVLANVFGFSSGTVGTKRKRRVSHRKHSAHHHPRNEFSGDSSEWTSESDSEAYVSPPRGRRNRQTRKYLKPSSARILSLEEEGGLFVMYGKKIYPLVKDGKIVKNYLTYLPESDPEEEESYWKLKYVEEKKRVDELRKLVNNNQTKISRETSPILPGKTLRNISLCQDQRSPTKSAINRKYGQEPTYVPVKENNGEESEKGKTLKITFAKNNQEIHVEGHWSNIHPVLAEVAQIFNKDTEPAKECQPNGIIDLSKHNSDASSDKSVAIVPIIDKAVHEKVNQLETEIFKEIEKRDQEQVEVKELPESKENVTKRKRTPRAKRSSSNQSSAQTTATSSPRSPKRLKISDTDEKESIKQEEEVTEQKLAGEKSPKPKQKSAGKKVSKTENKSVGKKTSSKQKIVKENVLKVVEQETKGNGADNVSIEPASSVSSVRTRRQTQTPKKDDKKAATPNTNPRSGRTVKTAAASPAEVEDDEEVRYMFPPEKKVVRTPKSALSLSKAKGNKRYTADTPKIYSSPNLTVHSESTQGYQDSDISPPKAILRRKRKLSLTTALTKIRHRSNRSKRKSYPVVTDDMSNDSNSGYRIIVRRSVEEGSSLKSEAYRSDSYQYLFPQSNVFRPLEKIDEHTPMIKNLKLDAYKKHLDINMNNDFASLTHGVECGSSSNVSLPPSPELSIVENLSISREVLSSVQNHPNLNELQASHLMGETRNKYLISQVDVSMPLMEQHCNFCPTLHDVIKTEPRFDMSITLPAISDSLVNKTNVVNIEDGPSLSESLDTRLRNLLLDSAKKMSIVSLEKCDNEGTKAVQRKPKSGKTCSTPRKKKSLPKKKLAIADPVVEEECTESFSYGGRNSCPPAIHLITAENLSKENVDIEDVVNGNSKSRRKKKDVIKVKILRPRSKIRKENQPPNNDKNTSIPNDSGINETESIISNQDFNESVELIHNHSETCLHANACMPDSVEFIETSQRSIISLTSDSASANDRTIKDDFVFKDCEEFASELFCHNAQDWTNVNVREMSKANTANTSETVFHSPVLSDTSLITEDLSDDTDQARRKWYLLSEDETQTANANLLATGGSSSSFGANLRQIFPIACAVPNLSTITEMSENSRKPTLESDISNRQDSTSMFDNMNSN